MSYEISYLNLLGRPRPGKSTINNGDNFIPKLNKMAPGE